MHPGPTDDGDTFAVRASSRLATLLLLFAVVVAVVEIGRGVVGLAHGREVTFHGAVSVRPDDPRMPRYVDRPGVADVTVHIHDASAKQQLLALARDIPPILMFVAGLWLLRGLLVSVRRGDPFTERNVWRLRAIAALLIAVPAVAVAQHYIDNTLAASVPNLHEWPNGHGLLLNGLVGGLVVLALAAHGRVGGGVRALEAPRRPDPPHPRGRRGDRLTCRPSPSTGSPCTSMSCWSGGA